MCCYNSQYVRITAKPVLQLVAQPVTQGTLSPPAHAIVRVNLCTLYCLLSACNGLGFWFGLVWFWFGVFRNNSGCKCVSSFQMHMC